MMRWSNLQENYNSNSDSESEEETAELCEECLLEECLR